MKLTVIRGVNGSVNGAVNLWFQARQERELAVPDRVRG